MRNYDAVIGKVLPYMLQEHPNDVDNVLEFVEKEAREIYMDGLAVVMNHKDGVKERPYFPVGRVQAMSVIGVTARALMTIENPNHCDQSRFTSNAVANGVYSGISLGSVTTANVRATDGRVSLMKIPREVTLCRRGRRPGSIIEGFYPCRATIERLAHNTPTFLHDMVEKFGYKSELQKTDVKFEDDVDLYIDTLSRISQQKLDQDIAHLQLHPSNSHRISPTEMSEVGSAQNLASDSASDAAATGSPAAPAAPAANDAFAAANAANAAAATNAANAAAALDASRGVESNLSVPNVGNAQEMAALALKLEKELVEIKEKMIPLQARADRGEEIEKTEKAKNDKEFATIIESFKQKATKANVDPKRMANSITCAQDLYALEPSKGLTSIGQALDFAVHAAAQDEELVKLRAKNMLEQAHSGQKEYLDDISKQFMNLRKRERDIGSSSSSSNIFGSSAPATTALDRRFESPPASSSSSSASASASASAPATHPPPAQQMPQPPAAKKPAFEAPPPTFFNRAGDDTDVNTFDAAAQFVDFVKFTHRVPDAESHARGIHWETEIQASADGPDRPVTTLSRARQTPAAVEPCNFAPRWDNMLKRAALESDRRSMRHTMQCTQHGSTTALV